MKMTRTMRVFIVLENKERISLDVNEQVSVREIKKIVKRKANINVEELGRSEVLDLCYAGATLNDEWHFSDVGVPQGATLYAKIKEEPRPFLFVHCHHNGEDLRMLDPIDFKATTIGDLKSLISRKIGLPITIYRLIDQKGKELFDCNTMQEYGLQKGARVQLQTWDGWKKFLNLACKGFTSHVLSNLSRDETLARYQLRVALYIAAYFGHVDLAATLLQCGVRPDEPIGDHPLRMWCNNDYRHPDGLKAPVHVATERGQLAILRAFVHHNVCVVLAPDGYGLKALNIALRNKIKPCATFLLTKQWSKIEYSTTAMPLYVYHKMQKWAERCKEKVSYLYGAEKSSLKRKPAALRGVLLGSDVNVDGYSRSRMNSKLIDTALERRIKKLAEEAQERRNKLKRYMSDIDKRVQQNRKTKPKSDITTPSDHVKFFDQPEESDPIRLPRLVRRHSSASDSTGHSVTAKAPSIAFSKSEDQQRNSRLSKKKRTDSGVLLEKAKSLSSAIPLPLVSLESNSRPYDFGKIQQDDPAMLALNHYEPYRGCSPRENAINCLSLASNFSKIPWMQQVRIAMRLTERKVKRSATFVT